jgi:hypothetical protein
MGLFPPRQARWWNGQAAFWWLSGGTSSASRGRTASTPRSLAQAILVESEGSLRAGVGHAVLRKKKKPHEAAAML